MIKELILWKRYKGVKIGQQRGVQRNMQNNYLHV